MTRTHKHWTPQEIATIHHHVTTTPDVQAAFTNAARELNRTPAGARGAYYRHHPTRATKPTP